MVPSVALLSLLGAAAALAGVSSAPVEKDDQVEEMVTRCIVEVLLNGLSKPDAPPINPMCKELLMKSNHQKQEEKNVGEDIEFDTRHLSEPGELEKPPGRSVIKEQDLHEEVFKKQAEEGEKRHSEAGKHGENGNQQVLSQGSSYGETHTEEKKDDEEKRSEEANSYKRKHPDEEGSQEKTHTEEAEQELLEKKSFSTAGRMAEGDDKHSGGQMHSEESAHSEEKGKEEGEEEEEESSEKYHHSFHREYEDSYEKEEADAEKRALKPRHHHRTPRLGNSSEYKRRHKGEKRNSLEESSDEERGFWDKRSHYPKHYYEKRNSNEMDGSEEMEENSRSEEYQDKWHQSTEDEEEDVRHRNRESEEQQSHYERRSFHDEPQKEMRHHYEERRPYSKTSKEDVGKQHSYGRKDEKRNQHDKERQHLHLEQAPKPQSVDRVEEDRRIYNPEEGPKEEKRHPSIVNEEEPEKRHHSEGTKHGSNKRTLLIEEGYPRNHYLVQNVKRAANSLIPYYQQLRWKNRHTEKKDDFTDQFLGSEEEPRSRLNERDFLPEYNDYDSWEKQQLMDGLNHKHNENNDFERIHKFDAKRQYNRMDELAHLLNYRKKSAEFPELYTSKEDLKKGHKIRSGEGKLGQRPLTPEEEKELENLAAMDLELQKIAEKFNSNRRG